MEVLYSDNSLIVVNKPSGLLTIRDGYNPDLPTVKSVLEVDFGRCFIVHRLDKETSGVLLVARTGSVHRALNIAFQNHKINKCYRAIILGKPERDLFTIDLPLRINGDRKHRTVVDEIAGKPAKSEVKVLKSNGLISLVEIIIFTGYTHQIRAHLSASGFPLIGDKLYGDRKILQDASFPYKIDRTALHSYQLDFIHPVIDKQLFFSAEIPPDLRSISDLI